MANQGGRSSWGLGGAAVFPQRGNPQRALRLLGLQPIACCMQGWSLGLCQGGTRQHITHSADFCWQWLTASNAGIDVSDRWGNRPLHLALFMPELVRVLLNAGARSDCCISRCSFLTSSLLRQY
jgi:hypothetical protein